MSQFLQLLYEVGRAFSEVIELDQLIPLIIGKTKELINADGCAIILLDPDTQELFFPYTAEAAPAVDQRLAEMRIPVGCGIAGWVVRHGISQLVGDSAQDERWYPEVDRHTGMLTRSLLTAPLRTRHGVIGAIQLRSARAHAFTDDNLRFLDTLAENIAIAIANARRYQEVKTSEGRLRDQVAALHREVARSSRFADIIGTSAAMDPVFRLIEAAITAPITVLLHGETGTGKELIARAIHFNGPRHDRPFVPVNCGAVTESILESELFGHKKGAFTGAVEDRKGLFEVANGGTIFLDEVGEMTPAMQTKVLRVLENGEVLPVGERSVRHVDIRAISATNRDLERDVTDGKFREDLYYRLNIFPIRVPSLRERPEDIPLLVEHFLQQIAVKFAKPVAALSREALTVLVHHAWPGNVRELRNELERAAVLAPSGEPIRVAELSPRITTRAGAARYESMAGADRAAPQPPTADDDAGAPESLFRARAAFEARHIAAVLRRQDGKVTQAAKALGLSRSMLHKKIKEYGIS